MKNIQAIKVGNVVNISIEGKLHKKNCGNATEADELFRIVLAAKANPTDENIKKIRIFLNEKTRIGSIAGFETDLETGEAFLAGFNTPIPDTLFEVIKEYHDNDYPMDAVVNFWKLLMINPDKRVRVSLFNFIKTHDFVLTDKGYMVVYKAVDYKNKVSNDLAEFITNQYLHVRKDWKCSPNKYVVYRNNENGSLNITKAATAESWDVDELGVEIFGKLGDLFINIETLSQMSQTVYESKTNLGPKMEIRLGVPVQQARKNCDANPEIECSNGLHVGATKYVQNFGGGTGAVLVCLVNPANVIAVPDYDHSKMRVCEYFPIALASYENSRIDIIEQSYFESDYQTFEEAELEKMIALVKEEQLPIEKAMCAEDEERPMSELLMMLESRMIDLDDSNSNDDENWDEEEISNRNDDDDDIYLNRNDDDDI